MDQIAVILVDDDLHARNVFQLVMEYHNMTLTMFDNAETAIEHLQNNVPDVVVMDLFLPGLDGYQALDKIRRAGIAQDCSFIAATSYYTNDTQSEVISKGFDGYIAKPFSIQDLASYLAEVIDQHRKSST
jgi:CheY-like chemotaxis protein